MRCKYGAPTIAYTTATGSAHIKQASCNHWDCPVCGVTRARKEYGRMLEGVRALHAQGHAMYFLTFTCRGKELSQQDAIKGYMAWTNTALTALRKDAKKRGVHWSYVQVTELQKRGHPHSHILTTYHPADLHEGEKETWINRQPVMVPALRSEYLRERCVSAGLGDQYDISAVRSTEAATRYVAKYMFKPVADAFPKNWKRVRYSQSFPKVEQPEGDAWVLRNAHDWDMMSGYNVIHAHDEEAHSKAIARLRGSEILLVASWKDEGEAHRKVFLV